jgi:hypothetical protein
MRWGEGRGYRRLGDLELWTCEEERDRKKINWKYKNKEVNEK